jgi:hypothetical protein
MEEDKKAQLQRRLLAVQDELARPTCRISVDWAASPIGNPVTPLYLFHDLLSVPVTETS